MNSLFYLQPLFKNKIFVSWIIIHIGFFSLYLCNPYANNPLDFSTSLHNISLGVLSSNLGLSVLWILNLFIVYRNNPFTPLERLKLPLVLGSLCVLHFINLVPLIIYFLYLSFTYVDLSLPLFLLILKLYWIYFFSSASLILFMGTILGSNISYFLAESVREKKRELLINGTITLIFLCGVLLELMNKETLGYYSVAFSSLDHINLLLYILIFLGLFLLLAVSLIKLQKVQRTSYFMVFLIILYAIQIYIMPDPVQEKERFEQNLTFSPLVSNTNSNSNETPPLQIIKSTVKHDGNHHFTSILQINAEQVGRYKLNLAEYMKIKSIKDMNNVEQRYAHDGDVLFVEVSDKTTLLKINYAYRPNIERVLTPKHTYLPFYEAWYPRINADTCRNTKYGYLKTNGTGESVEITGEDCLGLISVKDFIITDSVIVPVKWSGSLREKGLLERLNNRLTDLRTASNKEAEPIKYLVIEAKSEYNSVQDEKDMLISGNTMVVKIDPYIPLQDTSLEARIMELMMQNFTED